MLSLLTVCCLVTLALTATVPYNDIPKLSPLSANVSTSSSYTMETLLPLALTAQSYFVINFSGSNIVAPNGSLSCSYLNQSSKAYVSFSNCSCLNNVCTMAPNTPFNQTYNLLIRFGSLTNPTFIADQAVSINVIVNSTTNANVNTTISYSLYSPNSIVMNQFTQSNYGVGSTNVTYTFNFSVGNYIPPQPMLQLSIPDGVGLNATAFSLTFYGQIVSANTTQVGSSLIFYFNYSGINPPSGFAFLSVTGFTNPQYIGQSGSFSLKMNTMACLSGCQISSISSNIFASSNTAGNLLINSLYSNDTTVNSKTTIITNLQFYAPIPVGGMLQIILPSNIKPYLPVTCQIINGYTLTDSSPATCSYNQTTNTISTVNFAYTNLAGPSTAAMSFVITNPSDTTPSIITFQTIDSSGRTIGISQNGYSYSSTPGILTSTVLRNQNTLDSSLTLTVNITFINKIPSNGKVRLLIPTEIAAIPTNTTPLCRTGITEFQCSLTKIGSATFSIAFTPSCLSSCTSFNFSVSNLVNPPYINPDALPLTLQTVNNDFSGIIDQDTIQLSEIPLVLHNNNITNVSIAGTGVIGTEQKISLLVPLNEYLQSNGGIVTVFLPANSTFVFTTPSASTISETKTVSIPTNYSLYDSNMKSISTVSLAVNCSSIKCEKSILVTLSGVTYSYSSKIYSPYLFSTETNSHYKISEGVIQYPDITLSTSVQTLTVKPTVTITGQTTVYNITFIPTLPIDNYQNGGYFKIVLPLVVLSSSNCSIITNVSLGFSLSCLIQQNSIKIYYTTGTPQSLQNVFVSLIINNIKNPFSTQPLNYTITSYYNSYPSQIFTSKYSLTAAATGGIVSTKANNTYGVKTTISLLTTFQFSLGMDDLLTITIPSGMFIFTNNQINVNGTPTNVTVVNNNTNQILTLIPKITTSVLNLVLDITNPSSTKAYGSVSILSSKNGYPSQTASVVITPALPMTLNITSQTTSRYTGDTVNLTINFTSNANSKFVKLILPVNAWSTSSATLLSLPLTNNSLITLNSTSTSLRFLNLINRISLIPLSTTLVLDCLDSEQNSVEITYIPASMLVADTPKPIQSIAFRSNSLSSNPINLTISVTGTIPQNNLSTISIYLPQYQFTVNPSVSCSFFNLSIPCNILSSSNNTLIINYPCTTYECSLLSFNLSLAGITNLYPDQSSIVLTVYSSGYVSQLTKTVATPPIQSSPLISTQISLSNTTVATPSVLSVSFLSNLVILSDSVIGISIEDFMFYKNSDCSYQVMNITFSGCVITESSNGYVTYIALKTLGMSSIPAYANISITIKLINAYSAVTIKDSALRIIVTYNNISVSTYSTTLGAVANATSFAPVSFSQTNISRSSSKASSTISLFIQVAVPVNYFSNSVFLINLPKTQVSVPESHVLNGTNCSVTFVSEDPLYYYYSLVSTICTSAICSPQSLKFILNGLSNTNYSYVQSDGVDVKLTYNQSDVCIKQTLKLGSIEANQAKITASRSNQQALTLTNISINITVTNPLPSSTLVKIDPVYQIFYKQIKTVWITTQSLPLTEITFNNTFQNTNNYIDYVIINLPSFNQSSFLLTISVTNSPLTPIKGSLIDVTIYNNTIIYYKNSQIKIQNEILPYRSNVSLTNSNPIVASSFNLIIGGSFDLLNLTNYQLSVSTGSGVCANCLKQSNKTTFTLINSNNFNYTISNVTNPSDTVSLFYTVTISSTVYIAYSNSIEVLPKTNAIQFSSNYSLSSSMVSSAADLSVHIIKSFATEILLAFPLILASKVNGCYFNNLKVTCNSTKVGSQWKIEAQGMDLTNGGPFILQITTYQYAITINDTIDLSIKLPKAVSIIPFTVTLKPKTLTANFSSTSYSVSTKSNYTLSLSLLNTSSFLPETEGTYVLIILPFSNSNVSSNSNYKIDDNTITLTSFSLSQTLTFSNVINPADNRKMSITIQQISAANNLTIGQQTILYQMTKLTPINLQSALRNTSNYNSNVQINLTIDVAVVAETLEITLPQSQVVYGEAGLKCWILAAMLRIVDCEIKSNGNNQLITITESSGWYGTHTVVIAGYNNVNFNKALSASDSITLNIINSQGYTCASLYQTKYLLPETSTGILALNNYSITSNTKLTPIELTFNFNLQNPLTSESSLILESDLSYAQTSQLACSLSSTPVPCHFQNNRTELNLTTLKNIKNGSVIINGLSVGIQSNSIAIYTYDKVNSGYIDSIMFANPYTYEVLVLLVRVLFPIHTVGSQNFTILVDTYLPRLTDHTYCLNIKINNAHTNESTLLINNNYTVTDKMNQVCLESSLVDSLAFTNVHFPSPSTVSITLQLVTNSILLASAAKSVQIMSSPQGFCNNVDCDLCSLSSSGQQYCFSCRQGKVSYDGKCQQQCPTKWFSMEGVCQECSNNCNDCFGPTDTECLSCNSPLIDDSGRCTASCPGGHVQDGYCLSPDKCVEGCSLCSPTGFCYECSKNYEGIGECRYTNPLPQTLLSYFVIGPSFAYFSLFFYSLIKGHGLTSLSASSIMLLSINQLFCNILLIPLTRSAWAMSLVSIILAFRLIFSIAIYQSYFKSILSTQKSQNLLPKPLTHKQKFISFIGHFIGVDAYQFYFSKIGEPTYNQIHFGKPIRLFNYINLVPRAVLFCFCIYILSMSGVGDMVYVPMVCMISQILISLCYLVMNERIRQRIDVIVDKCRRRNE